MKNQFPVDVPSPIDLTRMEDARPWATTALARRPARPLFFKKFSETIANFLPPEARVLELGSGPGFLAEAILTELPLVQYVALDFSEAMHELARERLGLACNRVDFVCRSFRDSNWPVGLDTFDAVVTHQAIHELRHKRYAVALHRQVREILRPAGIYLACDHFLGEGGLSNPELYMTVAEQGTALIDAGFSSVEPILVQGGLALHLCR